MLTKVRLEVEEPSFEAAAQALERYEQILQSAEAKRHGIEPLQRLEISNDSRPSEVADFGEQLGRNLIHELIEYDSKLPGYRGRRVVGFNRLDTRRDIDITPASTPS